MTEFSKWWYDHPSLHERKSGTTTSGDSHQIIAEIAWYAAKKNSAKLRKAKRA